MFGKIYFSKDDTSHGTAEIDGRGFLPTCWSTAAPRCQRHGPVEVAAQTLLGLGRLVTHRT